MEEKSCKGNIAREKTIVPAHCAGCGSAVGHLLKAGDVALYLCGECAAEMARLSGYGLAAAITVDVDPGGVYQLSVRVDEYLLRKSPDAGLRMLAKGITHAIQQKMAERAAADGEVSS
jgi:hypothetical protein